MSFAVETRKKEHRLVLGEEVSISDARELHSALKPLLAGKRPIVVDAGQVTVVHTAIVQLLIATKQAARKLEFSAISEAFARTLQRLDCTSLQSKFSAYG